LLEEFHEIPHTKIEGSGQQSMRKIQAQENTAQEAALLCVHYYALTNLSLG